MTIEEIATALAALGDEPTLLSYYDLTESWEKAGVGREAIEPVLRFMEEHAGWDLGSPGPLTHFIEHLRAPEYERAVLESFARHPTGHTAWLINRLLNVAPSREARWRLHGALRLGMAHPLADEYTVHRIQHFLDFQAGR